MHVSRVGTCREYPPNFGDNIPDVLQGEVQLYTIFGIPDGELRFQCEGTEIILCPQNTAECPQGQGAAVDKPHRMMVFCVLHTDKGVAWTYSNR
jgi:hypothetical protein